MISTMFGGDALSSSVAVAPNRSGKIASPPRPKVKASGGEPTNTSSARDAEHFPGIAVGDRSGGRDGNAWSPSARRWCREVKPSSATSSRPVLTASKRHRLVERDAVELGVVVGGAVEVDDLLEESAGLGAGDQLVQRCGCRISASAISALSTILVSSPARSIGMVLTTTAPALVAASQAATSAGLLAERISTRWPGLTP